MWKRWTAGFAAVALSLALVPAAAQASAGPADDGGACGWKGNVTPLIEKAERNLSRVDIAKRAESYFGPNVTVLGWQMMEVDLWKNPNRPDGPGTKATSLLDNRVTFNVELKIPGKRQTVTSVMQMRYDGLCHKAAVFVPLPWTGSLEVRDPKLSAQKALDLAWAFWLRKEMPRDSEVIGMNLMRPTTTPPDFGKFRWYVNFQEPGGPLRVVEVHIKDGKTGFAL